MKNKFDLTHKYSLITGSAGLLGEQHAIALLEINSNLILTDVKINKLKKLKKRLAYQFPKLNILIYKMNVADPKSISKVFSNLRKRKITLNVLINNAAIDSKVTSKNKITNSSKFENIVLEDWYRHIDVGLTGAMLCSKFFGRNILRAKDKGVILNIASDLSVIAPNHKIYKKGHFKPIMYSVIKHALIGMTKYLSTYWNVKGIRCNALSPGPVFNNQSKDFLRNIKKQIPLNRLATKDEYKQAVQFLCTDASSYMTGQNIIIDGGRSVW